MKIAIVILNWNGKKLLQQFLPSVVQYSSQAEIYVIDNASEDDSINFLKKNYPSIRIIQNKENYGFSKGYNEGLKSVEADIVCLLNSDVEVTENWITPIQKLFEKDERIAVVQPKLLDYKKKTHFEYAGAAGGFLDNLGYPFCRGRIFDTIEEDLGQYNDEIEIFWASGAVFFIRKHIFDEVGGLDEDYFAHQEEIDLCWRVKNKGYKIFYTYKSVVFHLGGATLSNMNPKKTFLNFRNSLFNLLKNNTLFKALLKIFLRLCLDGVAGIKFLFQRQFDHFFAIIRAHFSFYRFSLKMNNKRTISKKKNSFMVSKWIILEYFIKNKKKYTDL
ncbi:hypothetical protein UJ101_00046 [Flavobacteriaceae bacterium UJ101]|nr:hypothetical protein UJ101_00046 [Flavobacteriaceae bacterium UJ101]